MFGDAIGIRYLSGRLRRVMVVHALARRPEALLGHGLGGSP